MHQIQGLAYISFHCLTVIHFVDCCLLWCFSHTNNSLVYLSWTQLQQRDFGVTTIFFEYFEPLNTTTLNTNYFTTPIWISLKLCYSHFIWNITIWLRYWLTLKQQQSANSRKFFKSQKLKKHEQTWTVWIDLR